MVLMSRLLGKVVGRIIASFGAALFAFAMWQWSHFTTQSGVDDFYWPLIVRRRARLAFIPLNNLAMSRLSMSQIAPAGALVNLHAPAGRQRGHRRAVGDARAALHGREPRRARLARLAYNLVVVQRLVDTIAHAPWPRRRSTWRAPRRSRPSTAR